jgi:hypothetical protein
MLGAGPAVHDLEVRDMELPPKVLAAATDRRSGATEIAIVAAKGLLEAADDPELLAASVRALLAGQPAMAPMWHLARAARDPGPRGAGAALRALLGTLREDTEAAVATARAWLDAAVGPAPVATVSHSSLVVRVLAGRPEAGRTAAMGVLGADAIGPDAVLNATGSAELAARLPTLVVATHAKLVPGAVFGGLAAPGFEPVPLAALAAVVLGAEVLQPVEAGRRAAALSGDG